MSNERLRWTVSTLAVIAVLLFALPAGAARRFTSVQLNAPQPVEVTMGSTASTSLTYRITNTSTGGDASRGIYRLRFTAPAGYTFTGASLLPAGWAVTGTGGTLTVQTASAPCTNCIYTAGAGGAPKDFTITLGAIPAAAQDSVSTLSIQMRMSSGTRTNNGQTFVTRRALTAALVAYLPIQCTPDCTNWGATCTVTPSIATSGTHSLALIVRNNSTANWTGIIANPNPPTAVFSWAGPAPGFNAPATLTLAPGACGVVVWTVTMPNRTGTVFYQARARNSTGVATSMLATSNTVIVASPAAGIGQHCVFPGETTTVTMTVTNNGAVNLANLRPWGISTTLNGNHNSSTTTVNVAATAGFPSPAGVIRVESEEISYTGTTATSFTGCTRGANGSTATSHNNTSVSGPRPSFVGTAAPTYLSGPNPASIASLAPAAVNYFSWTYRIDGAAPQTYAFQGFVSAAGTGITSPVIASLTGTLGDFGVAIGSGATFGGGTLNAMTIWSVDNNGCDPVRQVDIQVPGTFTVLTEGLDAEISGFLDWSAAYGGGVATFSAGGNGLTSLTGDHTATVTTLTVAATAGFPAAGAIQVDAERITYTGTTATTFTGCSRVVGTAMPHRGGIPVYESRIATLNGNHTAATTTIAVVSTAGFPASGSIRIDAEGIGYAGTTAATFTGGTRATSGLAAAHTSGTPVYFPRLAVGQSGAFSLLFSNLPGAAGGYLFPVIVTDRAGRSRTVNTTVTIDASTPGGGGIRLWQEPTR